MENERAMSGCESNVKLCRYDWVVSCDGEVLVQWMLFPWARSPRSVGVSGDCVASFYNKKARAR